VRKFNIKNNPGFNFDKKKAQKYGERLENIKSKNKILTPLIVLKDAEKKSSPYHDEFIWDDTLAAYKWRIHTARNLISAIYVEIESFDEPVRMYESVIVDEERQYENIETISQDEFFMNQVLNEIRSDLVKLQKKYSTYKQLASFWDTVNYSLDLAEKEMG